MLGSILRLLIVVVARLRGSFTPRKSLLAVWRDAVAHRAMREVALLRFPNARLIAEGSTWRATFDGQRDHRDDTGTRITVSRISGAPFPLELRMESAWSAFEKRRGAREVEIGDPSFDDVFYIQGEESAVLAALTLKARQAVRSFAADAHLEITRHGVSIEISAADEATVDPMLGRVLELATELADASSIPRRLARNAVADRVAGVRLRNLVALAREFPAHEAAAEAFRSAVNDLVPEVRLRAALAFGDQGRPTLEQMAGDGEVPDECSAEAVSGLGDHLSVDRQLGILHTALKTRRLETAAACIESLARSSAPEANAMLCKVLGVEPGRLAVAAARALGEQSSARSEAALRDAIERDEEPDVRLSAAESLGRVGTVVSVPSLLECAHRYPGERPLQIAIRQAVAEIQSRRLGAEHGQLSLAAPASGALSLTDDAGRLSFAGQGDVGASSNTRENGPQ